MPPTRLALTGTMPLNQSSPDQHLSPLERERLVTWLMAHPEVLAEDTAGMPWHYRHHRVRPALRRDPRAWLCLHLLAGVAVALAFVRRAR
jgi:hypothetical protein